MKILELNFEKGWRGGERQTLYNMQGFRDAGNEVSLICRKNSSMEANALQAGFTVHSYSSIFGVLFFLLSKARSYRIVHAQTSHILTYCILTKPFHGAKIIFTRRVNFKPHSWITKQKYLAADTIVGISESVKNIIKDFCGRKDILVISDIVVRQEPDTARAKQLLSELDIHNKYIIATTAALTFEKDPLTTVDVIKEMSNKRNDFVFLHFGAGDMETVVQEKIKANKLEHIYFLVGHKTNVEDFFSIFDVFVLNSIEEGLGSSVLDAFIYKVPAVTTNAGGLKTLLDNERGIVCEVKDYKSIATGINRFLNDSEFKHRTVENAFSYVSTYHGMQYITEQYMKIIKKDFNN